MTYYTIKIVVCGWTATVDETFPNEGTARETARDLLEKSEDIEEAEIIELKQETN